jgi:starch-binding outer membrane protein, SusD/RagB family
MKFLYNFFVRFIKKNRESIILYLFIVSLALYSGCKKWLEKPQNNQLAIPVSLTELQALLDDKENLNDNSTPSMLEASADDYFLLQSEYNVLSAIHSRIAPYNWDMDPYNNENDWKSCYYPVYVANLCLQQIEKIQKTYLNASAWNNIKGSAHFLRAYFFLELVWTYSKAYDKATSKEDLGIALRLTSDINEKSVRANLEQSYQQIISDAKAAIDLLPDRSIHSLRPSKVAAYGLLARTFLSMRDYENAYRYSDLALGIYDKLINYNNDSDIIGDFTLRTPPFLKYNKEIIFYTMMNSIHPSYLPSYAKIDSLLYATYDSIDLRKEAFFFLDNKYCFFKGTYAFSQQDQFSGIATDELWLIRAECLARIGGADKKGDKDGALNDLNTLLRNRYKQAKFVPVSAINADEALAIILLERRKELLMRGLRWADLKRLNKEGANKTITRMINGQIVILPPNDNRYAQPLPNEIILLTGMPQNPR